MKQRVLTSSGSRMIAVLLALAVSICVGIVRADDFFDAIAKPGSLPVTFTNDADVPWVADKDAKTISVTSWSQEKTSTLTMSCTVKSVSAMSFQFESDKYLQFYVRVDGQLYDWGGYGRSRYHRYNDICLVLAEGSHNIEIKTTNWSGLSSSGAPNMLTLTELMLTDKVIEVSCEKEGEFSEKVLAKMGDMQKADLQMLKVTGPMGTKDWSDLKYFTRLVYADLGGVVSREIPNSQFSYMGTMTHVVLPETCIKINGGAFDNTNLRSLWVPASVRSLSGFQNEYNDDFGLKSVEFAEGSQLEVVESLAFKGQTNLEEIELPATVKIVETHAFYLCFGLKKVGLPYGLETIETHAFYNCGFESIELPETVTYIGERAFAYCTNLKYAKLSPFNYGVGSWYNRPGTIMYYTFANCTALEKVVIPSLAAPAVYNSVLPFDGVSSEQFTIEVPSIALESFQNHLYWHDLNVVANDSACAVGKWTLWNNLTVSSSQALPGKADITVPYNVLLNLEEDAALNLGTFNIDMGYPMSYRGLDYPTRVVSNSKAVSADSIVMRYPIGYAKIWHFFTVPCDVRFEDVSMDFDYYTPEDGAFVIRRYDGARRSEFNENKGNWVDVKPGETLKRGQGYIVQFNRAYDDNGWVPSTPNYADDYLVFGHRNNLAWLTLKAGKESAKAFFSPESAGLVCSQNPGATNANSGWNFIGNPYPTFYDMASFDISTPVTVWDVSNSTYKAYVPDDEENPVILQPMQPFFVQVGSDYTFTADPAGRLGSLESATKAPKRAKPTEEGREIIEVTICAEGAENGDRTRVTLNPKAEASYEIGRDASKFMSMDAAVAQVFTVDAEGEALAINERPYGEGRVALGVYTPVRGGRYVLDAVRGEREVWLRDNMTGQEHNLSKTAYPFVADVKGTELDRFELLLSAGSAAVGDVAAENVSVTAAAGCILVEAPAGAAVSVCTADGKCIYSGVADGSLLSVPATRGVHIVRAGGTTVKTVVR